MLTPLRITAILMGMCGLLSACEARLEPGAAQVPQEGTQSAALAAPQGSSSKLLKAKEHGIPGRYIVVLEDKGTRNLQGAPMEVRKVSDVLARAHGGSVRRVYAHALRAFTVSMTEEEAQRMSEDPSVRYVEQERIFKVSGVQQFPISWGLDRVDQRPPTLDDLYTYEYTGAGVHAYIVDTGIRSTHQEFAGRMGNGFDAVGDGLGTEDCRGHGTHVAGTVGGTLSGVAKEVTLHSVRVITCSGEGTLEQVIAGIDWISANHVKPAVVNMSIGSEADQAVDDAVTGSIGYGLTYVVAAGNESVNACIRSPARTPLAITVGAISELDSMSFFSNYGGCVDLFAPGETITSAWYTGDSEFYDLDGTSMATPHVSGAVALFLEGHPNATPDEVAEEIVARGTRNLLTDLGNGSPNVLLHTACMGSTDSVPPRVELTAPAEGATLSGLVQLQAIASDNLGVSKVEFYLNGKLIGTASAAPFEITWDSTEEDNGPSTLSVRAFDNGCNSQEASIAVTLHNAGKASFDPNLLAPVCLGTGTQCDSGTLLNGRGPLMGPELNTPNTLGGSCPDGLEGWYQIDPSIERIRIVHDGGSLLSPGKQVRVEVSFFASYEPFFERLDLFSASDARNPVWAQFASLVPKDIGANLMSTSFIIPAGSSLQAVRAVYRFGGSPSACPMGNIDEADDLAFTVIEETDTAPPTATLTSPAAGSSVKGTVTLVGTASDNFAVTRVEFYDGDTLVGTDSSVPYSTTWDTKATQNGSHSLTARAYDSAGFVGVSPAVSVTVNNDVTPPTVAFAAPAAGATVSGTLTLNVTATDNVGVTKVEFYDGATLLATDATSPYTFSWATRTVPNGTHVLTAKGYDSSGNVGTVERTVTIDNDFTPPTATVTAPAEGASVSGTVAFTATATDDRSTLSRVEFYLDGTLLGTDTSAPFSINYNTRLQANGVKVLTAKAYDSWSNVGTSAPVSVTFDNDFTPPTVTLTAPTEGTSLIGTIILSATAADERSAMSRVEFYLGTTLIGSDSSAPYSINYNTRQQANGAKVLTAKAYDAVGNAGTSVPVNVVIDNDYAAPTVAVTGLAEGAALTGTLTFTATATDERSTLSRVDFYADTTLIGSDTTSPYSISYNTRQLANGAKVITAKAYDTWNNVGTSAPVNVTFDNDFAAPTVALTSPTDGAPVSDTLTLSATASDDRSTVSKVEFYVGNTLIGYDTTSPYSLSYNTRLQTTNGAKVLTAKAYDSWNNVSISAPVNVTFDNDFVAPAVTLTLPAEGSTVSETLTLSATASDDKTAISKVEFYVGTSRLATVTTPPYTYSYNTRLLANGAKVLTAKAYDAWNNVGTSAAVNVTFDNDFTGPTVALTEPSEGATLRDTVTFSATASDDRTAVSKVEFYVGTSRLATVTTAPYTYSYNTRLLANGAKVLTAKAYDAWNNVTTSAAVNVTFDNDFTAPTASVTSPANGATVSGVVPITCAASDNWGVISKVEIYTNSTLLGTVTTAPYTVNWDTTKAVTTNWPVRCRAFDPAGNSAYSPSVTVTVTR
ncbi:Ig-like domain-containing protein [Hyalangium minutum]|uniref:Alkaline serine exoprotease A n=1 Tax=Hyalangium minutum TaxID=394096 RepID=A0A085VZE2_9BACT|nr:Ig-like domain-containing protein [Hyalangium minutum]KFE60805.1 hypothetical protein DB31_4718 [Hyalangium minutum]